MSEPLEISNDLEDAQKRISYMTHRIRFLVDENLQLKKENLELSEALLKRLEIGIDDIEMGDEQIQFFCSCGGLHGGVMLEYDSYGNTEETNPDWTEFGMSVYAFGCEDYERGWRNPKMLWKFFKYIIKNGNPYSDHTLLSPHDMTKMATFIVRSLKRFNASKRIGFGNDGE